MPKTLTDDELTSFASEAREFAERLAEMRDWKLEHESALTKLDETQLEIVHRIREITEQLNHATDELRNLTHERTDRTDALRHLANQISDSAYQWRNLRRTIQNSVGRDVCPQCGSTNIAPIVYGMPIPDSDKTDSENDEPVVEGGCIVDYEETVCCLGCGKRYLGDYVK